MQDKAANVKLILIDVDGVLTDGSIIIDDDGRELKSFDVQDGVGIEIARLSGLKICFITGRSSKPTAHRARELHIDGLYQGPDKEGAYTQFIKEFNCTDEEVAYIGDDLIDLPLLHKAGFSACPPNAILEIKEKADYITTQPGGKGAVREVIEFILKSKNSWLQAKKRYFQVLATDS